jgi:hypothetical protein
MKNIIRTLILTTFLFTNYVQGTQPATVFLGAGKLPNDQIIPAKQNPYILAQAKHTYSVGQSAEQALEKEIYRDERSAQTFGHFKLLAELGTVTCGIAILINPLLSLHASRSQEPLIATDDQPSITDSTGFGKVLGAGAMCLLNYVSWRFLENKYTNRSREKRITHKKVRSAKIRESNGYINHELIGAFTIQYQNSTQVQVNVKSSGYQATQTQTPRNNLRVTPAGLTILANNNQEQTCLLSSAIIYGIPDLNNTLHVIPTKEHAEPPVDMSPPFIQETVKDINHGSSFALQRSERITTLRDFDATDDIEAVSLKRNIEWDPRYQQIKLDPPLPQAMFHTLVSNCLRFLNPSNWFTKKT